MKRFYNEARYIRTEDSWRITLDGKPVKTPRRAPLVVPSEALADAIVAEWAAQGDRINPRAMPMTGLANAAIDHVVGGRQTFIDGLAAFGESDLVCYRAATPADLAARQAAAWDPLIDWTGRRHGCRLHITTGIAHVTQDTAKLRGALDAMSDFQLAAMQPLVTIAGSLVIALALAEHEIDADAAFAAGELDERYQAEKWGDDAEALAMHAARRDAFNAAARFLRLL